MNSPFAISLGANTPGKVTEFEEIGNISPEISRFWYYCINYEEKLKVCIRNTKYKDSPIPSGKLEIPISLVVKIGTSLNLVFQKVENLIEDYCLKPEEYVLKKTLKKTTISKTYSFQTLKKRA